MCPGPCAILQCLVHTCVYSACVQFSCVYSMLWVMVIGSGMYTDTIMNNE